MKINHLFEKDKSEIEIRLEKLIKKYKIHGLNFALIKNYEIDFLLPLGKRDNKEKVTKNTLFQSASISKVVTSLIILKLVELKKIKLSDDVNKYLQDFKIRDEKVTIRQLLSHSGGVSCSGFRGYSHKEKIPKISQIIRAESPANSEKIFVKYKQGEYHYSGGGYTLLQKIIENITKDKFEDVAKKFIFEPLKMERSSFKKLTKRKTSNISSGYEENKKVRGNFFFYPEKAAAGLWTTAEDLAKLIIEIQSSYKGKSNKILSKTIIKKILNPIIKAEGNFMGLGIFISKDKNLFYHAGSNVGFKSKFVTDFKGNGIVVLTNDSKGYDLINDLVS
jgi:CubicO group peptidase (beta-lactamase class C family)|tara:strand:- start:128 stop:1129 length:1002 start_codon:yes stop_codon:yes gene_type:complete